MENKEMAQKNPWTAVEDNGDYRYSMKDDVTIAYIEDNDEGASYYHSAYVWIRKPECKKERKYIGGFDEMKDAENAIRKYLSKNN